MPLNLQVTDNLQSRYCVAAMTVAVHPFPSSDSLEACVLLDKRKCAFHLPLYLAMFGTK